MKQEGLTFPEPLTEKYRPRHIEDFIGLQKVRRILETFIAAPRSCAWLFNGTSGIGKTTIALAMAEQLNAELHHIPSKSADLDTVETVTKMCHSAAFNFKTGKPCAWHLVLMDEADQMTPAAQNSLLSKLDATAFPPQTIFVFTCNSKIALEPRFLSRCRELEFRNETLEGELESFLTKIYKKEGGKYPVNFTDICKAAQYNVRDALNKLELELMIGDDRDGLPSEDIRVVESHDHDCKKCRRPFKHTDPKCELPYLHVCPSCGGARTVGSLRANKAWDTIRRNILSEGKRKKPRRR